MNVLLVKPYWVYPYSKGEYTYNRIWPPIALANSAALLEQQGHKVQILDAHALRIKPADIPSSAEGYDQVFVTSSTLDRWQCPNMDITSFYNTVAMLRSATENVYVMGYHGTVDPEAMLLRTRAKAVIRGAPEQGVVSLCGREKLEDIGGISYEQNGRIVSSAARGELDMKEFPVPAYHLLDVKKYQYEILGRHFMLFETQRGCPYQCRFCNKMMYPEKLMGKSIEQIQKELSTAMERYGVRSGYFIDLDFLIHRDITEQICEFLIKKKYSFKWCCQTRPDQIQLDLLKMMKSAGCQLIHLGVESGLEKFLTLSQKHSSLKSIEKAVSLCEQVGIQTLAFYLFGFKGESSADRQAIFEYAKRLNTNYVSFHKIYPYQFDEILMPDLLHNEDIDKFIRAKTMQYYLRWNYLKKAQPLAVIRSLNLLFGRYTSLMP
ncbi:MAG: B12-binding domain-containing radical SAM protein [Candidatus Omnitrophica bacterium]|nr:B12-binding domain-containing radical SAM protein [Candidatus Omnitrophota bacterium]